MSIPGEGAVILTVGYGRERGPVTVIKLVEDLGLNSFHVRFIDIRRRIVRSRNPHARGPWPGAERHPALGNLGKTRYWERPPEADEDLRAIAAWMQKTGRLVCLICCETDPRRCHRATHRRRTGEVVQGIADALADEVERRTGERPEIVHLP